MSIEQIVFNYNKCKQISEPGEIHRQSANGLNWVCNFVIDYSYTPEMTQCHEFCFLSWEFEWDELEKQGIIGFGGEIEARNHLEGSDHIRSKFPVLISKSCRKIEKRMELSNKTKKENSYRCFYYSLKLKPMNRETAENLFVDEELNDVTLLVEGVKVPVNKALLAYHSQFFEKLFNSDFKEKDMNEIPIEDVSYMDFLNLLTVINLEFPNEATYEKMLELADRFLMPHVKQWVEKRLIGSEMRFIKMLLLADKFNLTAWMKSLMGKITSSEHKKITLQPEFKQLSLARQVLIFERIMKFFN